MLSFDEERELRIKRNKELIAALGLNTSDILPPPKGKPPKAKAVKKRRKSPTPDTDESRADEPPSKVARVDSENTVSRGLRRSGRHAGKPTIDYAGGGDHFQTHKAPRIVSAAARKGSAKTEPKIATQRTQNPKRYGAIPGIATGTWWETRMACSVDAVHAPTVAGITCGPEGAYSVALSGGYEDDVDLGEAFTYTGSGGRDLKGTKQNPKNLRTAPQSSDQTWENSSNSALQRSVESKKPVRVIRGFKLRSPYAPEEGYRYDGLYTVEKAWQERGLNPKGYLVCKFLFKRMPGQSPLPIDGQETDDVSDDGSENASESSTTVVAEEVVSETDASD